MKEIKLIDQMLRKPVRLTKCFGIIFGSKRLVAVSLWAPNSLLRNVVFSLLLSSPSYFMLLDLLLLIMVLIGLKCISSSYDTFID